MLAEEASRFAVQTGLDTEEAEQILRNADLSIHDIERGDE